MKKALLVSLTLFVFSAVSLAQIAEWRIPAKYDGMIIPAGTQMIMTDSAGVSTTLWSFDGKKLAQTDGDIHPFRDGFAVTTNRGTDEFRGFYSDRGLYVPLAQGKYHVGRNHPYPSSGHLLVQDPESGFFQYVNLDGSVSSTSFIDAFPFMNGFASCQTYANPEKMKGILYHLLDPSLNPVRFAYNGKVIDPSDIDFISSVNDEGIAVLVIKKKVFLFHANEGILTPLCSMEDLVDTKKQAKITMDFGQALVKDSDSNWRFSCRCAKNEIVTVLLDDMMAPYSILYVDQEKVFEKRIVERPELTSPLRTSSEDGAYGLYWEKEEQLPPQFEEWPFCFDDKAIVKMSGKYGLLQMHPDDSFQLSMFKGKDIPFKHQTLETNIRLDLPSYILAEKTAIEVDPSSGCEVDRKSAEMKNTQFGNYIQYECILHMPDSLPDVPTEIVYPTRVFYDGLVSSTIPFTVKAWYYKYFVVDVLETDRVVDNGSFSFTFDINAGLEYGDEAYRRDVTVQTDSLTVELDKLSETRYKCLVKELKEGFNSIVVQVVEQGCPPVAFPFEITYTKPVAATKTEPAVEETVTIQKKDKLPARKSSGIPDIEM